MLRQLRDKVGRDYCGEIEIEIRDRRGNIVRVQQENLIKIFAKEILAHRVAASMKWDPIILNNDGSRGAWVQSGVDPMEDYSLKYMVFGASFDQNGQPLDVHDPRFYQQDPMTGQYRPITLSPGAQYGGGLINAIPINEQCGRPLKYIESFKFEPTYQPAGTPYLHDDVRGINNILVVETTLRVDEYNGLTNLPCEYFTLTEVALVGAKYVGRVTECNIDPHDVFIEGPYQATVKSGTNVVKLLNVEEMSTINTGDQIRIVGAGSSEQGQDQINPYYLVIDRSCLDGSELILDRVPKNRNNEAIFGNVLVYRDTFKIFAHRILQVPVKKSADFEIIVRWKIIFS